MLTNVINLSNMNVNYIETDTNMMRNTYSDMSDYVSQLESLISQAYDEIKELDAMWEGNANNAFNVQFEKDRAQMLLICESIKRYIDDMENARSEYDKCENRVEEIVRSLRI